MRVLQAGYGVVFRIIVLAFLFVGVAFGEAVERHPHSGLPVSALDLAPSNPLGLPGSRGRASGGSDTAIVSSEMFPAFLSKVPGLNIGFSYLFGQTLNQSHWSVDYLRPVTYGDRGTFYGELHGDFTNYNSKVWVPFLGDFWKLTGPAANYRYDLAVGVGYRKMLGEDVLVGVNTFFDATRLLGSWNRSGSFGLEMAANGPGDSAVDLTFNCYSQVYGQFNSRGSVFPAFNIIDEVRNGSGNYDMEVGYSNPIFDRSLDLRLKLTGYRFAVGNQHIGGLQTGAQLTTRDGVFRVAAEYGHDDVYGSYGRVAAFVNVGFQLENILRRESPFSSPEPVFQSPRNLKRLLTQPAKRNWYKPSQVVVNPRCEGLPDDSYFQLEGDPRPQCFYSGGFGGCRAQTIPTVYVIDDTPGGLWAAGQAAPWIQLDQFHQKRGVVYDRDISPMFACGSSSYARNAVKRGIPVYAYVRRSTFATKSTIFWTTEWPILRDSGVSVNWFVDTPPGSNTWVPCPDCPNALP